MSAAARALDAADGVIDGRYYGRPIVQAGAPQFATAAPQYAQFATAAPQFAQFAAAPQYATAAPQFYGATAYPGGYATATPLIRTAAPSVIPNNSALALDAADGVIDGRFYGRPIVQGGAQQFVGAAPQFVGAAPQFVGAAPQFVGAAPQFVGGVSSFGAPSVYGGQLVRSVPTTTVGSSALALDAADGVIDGRFYGRPIVQGGAPGAVIGGSPYYGGAQLLSGAVQPAFYQQPQFTSVVPTTQVLRTVPNTAGSTAAALDAADGVIDGRYFGRPIVQAGRPF